MAGDAQVKQLQKEIELILAFDQNSLIHRTKWGEITFEAAERDISRIYEILGYLKILPLEYLTDQIIGNIINSIISVKTVIDQIDKFNIQVPNPVNVRASLISQIHQQTDNLYTITSSWIPFLAYQKGDVAANINQLTTSVEAAKKIIDDAKDSISKREKEIGDIIIKAREASGKVGVAVFTQDFQKESENNMLRAKRWLKSTIILAAGTLIIAGAMWCFIESGLDDKQIWQKITTKIAILILMLSATGWCAKIYKAFIHQATVNRHRALSLQTFQAFTSAGSNDQTKDAVLLQTTRSIFSDMGTGFVDSSHSSNENDIKILEVVKSFLPKNP